MSRVAQRTGWQDLQTMRRPVRRVDFVASRCSSSSAARCNTIRSWCGGAKGPVGAAPRSSARSWSRIRPCETVFVGRAVRSADDVPSVARGRPQDRTPIRVRATGSAVRRPVRDGARSGCLWARVPVRSTRGPSTGHRFAVRLLNVRRRRTPRHNPDRHADHHTACRGPVPSGSLRHPSPIGSQSRGRALGRLRHPAVRRSHEHRHHYRGDPTDRSAIGPRIERGGLGRPCARRGGSRPRWFRVRLRRR
jgi:hypothetical protein